MKTINQKNIAQMGRQGDTMKKTKQQLEREKLELEIEHIKLTNSALRTESRHSASDIVNNDAEKWYRTHLVFDSISYAIQAAALVSLAVYVWR